MAKKKFSCGNCDKKLAQSQAMQIQEKSMQEKTISSWQLNKNLAQSQLEKILDTIHARGKCIL